MEIHKIVLFIVLKWLNKKPTMKQLFDLEFYGQTIKVKVKKYFCEKKYFCDTKYKFPTKILIFDTQVVKLLSKLEQVNIRSIVTNYINIINIAL